MNKAAIVDLLNAEISKFIHFELSLYSLSQGSLIIAGSEDFSYYHNFEIIFTDVFSIFFNETIHLNTDKPSVFLVTDTQEAREINIRLGIIQGNTLFKFIDEDARSFYVAANDIKLNLSTTFYYKRENLLPGEKIADWVKD